MANPNGKPDSHRMHKAMLATMPHSQMRNGHTHIARYNCSPVYNCTQHTCASKCALYVKFAFTKKTRVSFARETWQCTKMAKIQRGLGHAVWYWTFCAYWPRSLSTLVSLRARQRWCVATCCSMLQYVAVCCSMLQYVAVRCSMLQYVAVRCSMLQCIAVSYSVLQ